MVEEIFNEMLNKISENNDISDKIKIFLKIIFTVGFRDGFYAAIEIMRDETSIYTAMKLGEMKEDINRTMRSIYNTEKEPE